MPLIRIKKWLKNTEKYFFKYKDGFFILPYLANTPKLMLESWKSMPFTAVDEFKQCVSMSNPFIKGKLYYEEVETGLWMIVADVAFKANVHTQTEFDEGVSDYYFLAFSIFDNPNTKQHNIRINGDSLASNSWAIYGPDVSVDAFFDKGTKGLFYSFSFHKNWLFENLLQNHSDKDNFLSSLTNTETKYLNLEFVTPELIELSKEIWIKLSKQDNDPLRKLHLKIKSLEIIDIFFSKLSEKNQSGDSPINSKLDIQSVQKTVDYLIHNLQGPFCGIDFLAANVNMSSSKLKNIFKLETGNSIYKYFKDKQMDHAMSLLLKNEYQVKNLANLLGYENTSKFSAAFKKHHNKLPSEVMKENRF